MSKERLAVEVTLEPVHVAGVRKFVVADYLGHVSSFVLRAPGPGSRSRRSLCGGQPERLLSRAPAMPLTNNPENRPAGINQAAGSVTK